VGHDDVMHQPQRDPGHLARLRVGLDAEIEELFTLALDQNFVPVVDDRQVFIGIVRRRSILAFLQDRMMAALRASIPPPTGA
jgi:hypothetical protein